MGCYIEYLLRYAPILRGSIGVLLDKPCGCPIIPKGESERASKTER